MGRVGGVAVDDELERGVVVVPGALGGGVGAAGEQVVQGLADREPPVDALAVEVGLAGVGVLAYPGEAAPLVRGEVAGAAEVGEDVRLVGGGVRDGVAHARKDGKGD